MTHEVDEGARQSAGQGTTGMTFPAFVLSLARTAAVHFGDIVDPASGAIGVPNLLAARQMIELLGLLQQKTRGNLSAEERQLLEQLLAELHVRFAQAQASASRLVQP